MFAKEDFLDFRVTEFRFICWLVEMRWVGTFKPHLILTNLLIVVIQLTFMEFSSWHPIKTPLLMVGTFSNFRTYRIYNSFAWSMDPFRRFRWFVRDQPISRPPKGSKTPMNSQNIGRYCILKAHSGTFYIVCINHSHGHPSVVSTPHLWWFIELA